MQTAIRHDGLERMICAFRFFAALFRGVRDSGARNGVPVTSQRESPTTV